MEGFNLETFLNDPDMSSPQEPGGREPLSDRLEASLNMFYREFKETHGGECLCQQQPRKVLNLCLCNLATESGGGKATIEALLGRLRRFENNA